MPNPNEFIHKLYQTLKEHIISYFLKRKLTLPNLFCENVIITITKASKNTIIKNKGLKTLISQMLRPQ